MTMIETVKGPVPEESLGRVLAHEHIFVLSPEIQANYPEEWGDEEDEAEFYLGESALMAEQTAILESIQDEAYVESNRRFLREEQAKTDVLFNELDAE